MNNESENTMTTTATVQPNVHNVVSHHVPDHHAARTGRRQYPQDVMPDDLGPVESSATELRMAAKLVGTVRSAIGSVDTVVPVSVDDDTHAALAAIAVAEQAQDDQRPADFDVDAQHDRYGGLVVLRYEPVDQGPHTLLGCDEYAVQLHD